VAVEQTVHIRFCQDTTGSFLWTLNTARYVQYGSSTGFLIIILGTFIAHYPRESSMRFTFTLTLLAVLPG
jgi:hypothetical protein